MAQEEEVPEVRIRPPAKRPVLPESERPLSAVRSEAPPQAVKRAPSTSHTIAVGDKMYQALLHAKHAVEVRERRLVSFGEVIQALLEDQEKLRGIEERIAAKRAARAAEEEAS